MSFNKLGTFHFGKKTQNAATVIVRSVFPYTGQLPGGGTGQNLRGIPHVTTLVYDQGTTPHVLTCMRPLNWTTFSADAAAAQAVVNITVNPGAWQTAGVYKYPLPNGSTAPSQGNNLLAANDYVMYQTATGLWITDTVSSISSLAVTLATNLPTGGVKAGGRIYHFGITTDTDPATGEAHPQTNLMLVGSSTALRSTLYDANGLFCALHPGDGLILHSDNATAQGYFQLVAGFYLDR